jgi:hypothetical protein
MRQTKNRPSHRLKSETRGVQSNGAGHSESNSMMAMSVMFMVNVKDEPRREVARYGRSLGRKGLWGSLPRSATLLYRRRPFLPNVKNACLAIARRWREPRTHLARGVRQHGS